MLSVGRVLRALCVSTVLVSGRDVQFTVGCGVEELKPTLAIFKDVMAIREWD